MAYGRGRWAVSQKPRLIHKYFGKNTFINSCCSIGNGPRFETNGLIRFHETKTAKKDHTVCSTHLYSLQRVLPPGMLSLIVEKIFPQRLKQQTYIKYGIFKRIYRWTAKLLQNLLSNYWYINKFGSWSYFNMLVLGSECFYFIDRVIYTITDNFSSSELICYLQD